MRPCIGCGKTEVEGPTFWRRCRGRIARGLPTDLDDNVTCRESKRAQSPRGHFDLGWRTP